jgi:gamma-glutamyltranspeptidase/glutathione hydrolase
MVSAGHPLASQSALRVLYEGGNAVDAVLAATAVLGVVRPFASTIGGDLFALVRDAASGEISALSASGPAPRAATIGWYRAQGHRTIPNTGLLSIETPGLVDGFVMLQERYATRSLADLLAPAIDYAAEGFPVYPGLAQASAQGARLLAERADTAAIFLPDDRPLRVGQILKQPALAESLRAIAAQGQRAYYGGPIGEAIGRYCLREGGLLAPDDFQTPPGEWRTPIEGEYRGYTIYETPPVSQGFVLLQELAIVAGYDLAALGPSSADTIHLMVEAKKLAFAERLAHLGDAPLALAELLSPARAAELRARIDPQLASDPRVAAYDRHPRGSDTTVACVVDQRGNAAVVIQSVNSPWGSGVFVPDVGVLLNNRLQNFFLDEGHPNALAPGRRTAHTLNAFVLERGGELVLVGGTPGADDQVQTSFQLLVGMLDYGLNPQQAADAPKWSHRPGTLPGNYADAYVLAIDNRVGEAVLADLEARGHRLERAPEHSFGAHKLIARDPATGVLMGAASPGRDGYAIGW